MKKTTMPGMPEVEVVEIKTSAPVNVLADPAPAKKPAAKRTLRRYSEAAGEYRFLLRHHAESLVQICNNLTVAVDKVAVDSADGILIGLLTATQFIDFFLIHWFCQTFRYDCCWETP